MGNTHKRFPLPPYLHLLDESSQCLQPGHHVNILLCVHDLDLLSQLRDDGACPPAVLQRQILKSKRPVLNCNTGYRIISQFDN